jgi:riboflavin synthase alpha subunit
MTSCPPHFVRGHVRIMIALHQRLYDQAPRRILVGLMEMAALEEIAGLRPPGSSLAIDGIPVQVGSLEDRVCGIV